MITRLKDDISKPKLYSTDATSPHKEPTTVKEALLYPTWRMAMEEEKLALHHNQIWKLVPSQPHFNVLGTKWVFCVNTIQIAPYQNTKPDLLPRGSIKT